eukprot:1188090-Prorocentrum_minimum.AAC.1
MLGRDVTIVRRRIRSAGYPAGEGSCGSGPGLRDALHEAQAPDSIPALLGARAQRRPRHVAPHVRAGSLRHHPAEARAAKTGLPTRRGCETLANNGKGALDRHPRCDYCSNLTSCYGSSCANNSNGALNTLDANIVLILLHFTDPPVPTTAREAGLFDFRRQKWSDTVLLVVDRLDDPVTPLLTQWTYQAMVHELIGMQNHRVDLRQLTGRVGSAPLRTLRNTKEH